MTVRKLEMQNLSSQPKPKMMDTPWGRADYQKELTDGIVAVATPTHGGIFLDEERNQQVPRYMRKADGWYEEDCDWCIPAVVFPDAFEGKQGSAAATLANCHPDAYEKFFDAKITPGMSYKRDQENFEKENAEKLVVISAYGTWHEAVPEGKVGVIATVGGKRGNGTKEHFFLVNDAEYKRRDHFGYIIKGHEEGWIGPR